MINNISVGVDIIDLRKIPNFLDKSEERFFKDNYTQSEVDFILKKNDKRKYFAIFFSIKESIVKCENIYIGQLFNTIEINFYQNIPIFNDLIISFSSSDNLIITTAIKMG